MTALAEEAEAKPNIQDLIQEITKCVKLVRDSADLAEEAIQKGHHDLAAEAFVRIAESGVLGARLAHTVLTLRSAEIVKEYQPA